MSNNACSMEISKWISAQENDLSFPRSKLSDKNTLDESNREPINDIPEPLSMFDNILFNDSIVEGTWIHIKADEGGICDTFLFERQSTTGMLWKIQDSYLMAKISLHTQNNAKWSAGTIVDFIPRPLNTWLISIKLSINRVAITVSHTDNLEVSNMINISISEQILMPSKVRAKRP